MTNARGLHETIRGLATAFADAITKAIASTPLGELSALHAAAPTPAKRGRPPTTKAKPRKRTVKTKSAKRGRPKGSKNKPKPAPTPEAVTNGAGSAEPATAAV